MNELCNGPDYVRKLFIAIFMLNDVYLKVRFYAISVICWK